MVIRRKTRNTSLGTPLGICLLAAASSIVLTVVVISLSTPPVQADALIPRTAASASPTPPVASATPTLLAPKETAPKTASQRRADILHGLASWYGGVFNGRLTASGERFDMNAMTACHPTLPFGTVVRVKNLRNKRSCVVRITDRGYLLKGRIIDLSYAAAEELAMTKSGVVKVDLEVISLGKSHDKN